MRNGNYRFRRPRCCGSMKVSAYIRHGKEAPDIEKIWLYCPRCKRFEIERPMHTSFTEFVRKFPILNLVANALKPYMKHNIQVEVFTFYLLLRSYKINRTFLKDLTFFQGRMNF